MSCNTQGILAGQNQFGKERGYDFPAVLKWFAERVDRILILFDAHKLDISDEFKKVLDAIKQHEEKVNSLNCINTFFLKRNGRGFISCF